MLSRTFFRAHAGLTLIELLVSLAILSILLLMSLIFVPKYLYKANDAKRKSDLETFHIAFEHYYEDHQCYPSVAVLSQCNSTLLEPYISKIMCDPESHQPYTYVVSGATSCSSYKLYTNLKDTTDPDISRIGCANGCGPANTTNYNYGISSSNGRVGIPQGTQGGGGGAGGNGDTGGQVTPNCSKQPDGSWTCTCTPGDSCGLGCPGNTRCGDGTYCFVDPSCN